MVRLLVEIINKQANLIQNNLWIQTHHIIKYQILNTNNNNLLYFIISNFFNTIK